MKKELQEKLYENYPAIFRQKDLTKQETAMCWGISCGDGWYNILDTLCFHLRNLVDQPHRDTEMYKSWIQKEQEKNEGVNEEWIERCKQLIKESQEKTISQIEAVQVKEKYGTLRFYLNEYPTNKTVDAKMRAYINFAESLSACTCEMCGVPAKQKTGGWIKTICEPCEEKRSQEWQKQKVDLKQLKIPFPERK